MPVLVKHNTCGREYEKVASEALRYGCSDCANKKAASTRYVLDINNKPQTLDTFVSRLHDSFGERYSYVSGYKAIGQMARFRCNNCGREFTVKCGDLLSGYRDCNCEFWLLMRDAERKKEMRRKEREQKKIEEQIKLAEERKVFLQQVQEIWGDEFEILSEFIGWSKNVSVKHNNCGNVSSKTPRDLVDGHGCLSCSRAGQSSGVRTIEKYLKAKGIKFDREVKLPGCRRIRSLLFDFALYGDKGRLIALIEYDGELHYRSPKRYGGEVKLRLLKERDKIKNEYCKSKGIMLVRIPYTVKDITTALEAQIKMVGSPRAS